MASVVLNATPEPLSVGSIPRGTVHIRPSKIPVRTGHSNGSASDDSDISLKSESKTKTVGKSHLPVPVKTPAKKNGASGSESDPEKNSSKEVQQNVVPTTGNIKATSREGDIKLKPTSKSTKKIPARLESLKPVKRSSSVNQARCGNAIGLESRQILPGINKKQRPAESSSAILAHVQQGRLRPARKFQPKKTDDLPEKEQDKSSSGISRRTGFINIHDNQNLKYSKPVKETNTGLKEPKRVSPSSKKHESSKSSLTATRTKDARKVTNRKKKDSESEDLLSTDSASDCAPKDAKRKTKKIPSKKEKINDSEGSDNSLGIKPRSFLKFEYEETSDEFFTTDSELECVPKKTHGEPSDVPCKQDKLDSEVIQDSLPNTSSVSLSFDDIASLASSDSFWNNTESKPRKKDRESKVHATCDSLVLKKEETNSQDKIKEQHSETGDALGDVPVTLPEADKFHPQDRYDDDSRQSMTRPEAPLGFYDDMKIKINFAYEESEFSGTASKSEGENRKEQSEERRENTGSDNKGGHLEDGGKEDASLTDYEIESICEDNEDDTNIPPKEDKDPCDSKSGEVSMNYDASSIKDQKFVEHSKSLDQIGSDVSKDKYSHDDSSRRFEHSSDSFWDISVNKPENFETKESKYTASGESVECWKEECKSEDIALNTYEFIPVMEKANTSRGFDDDAKITIDFEYEESDQYSTTEYESESESEDVEKEDNKMGNEMNKTDLKDSQVVDDVRNTDSRSSHSNGNEGDAANKDNLVMEDEANSKDKDVQSKLYAQDESKREVKLFEKSRMFVGLEQVCNPCSVPSNKANSGNKVGAEVKMVQQSRILVGNDQKSVKEIANTNTRVVSADKDSFMEELEEMLSEVEVEIKEASLKEQANDAYFDGIFGGMVTASNDTDKKEGTSSGKTSGSSNTQQSGKRENNNQETGGGGRGSSQGCSAGGSGDDDPNNPRKPKPGKEPQDKMDDMQEKHRVAKKAWDKQVVEIKNERVEEKCQALGQTSTQTKASQTNDEGNVEELQKIIRSKDKEILLRQNLVDCCRKDYEELQESFNQYTNDFKEVDENRLKISALTNENTFLKHENSKLKTQVSHKGAELTQAQEKSKRLKNKISKMEVDLDFLRAEQRELLKKVQLNEASTPPGKVEIQKEVEKEPEDNPVVIEYGLGRTCSLQDVEVMKVEEENSALKTKLAQCEASLKTQKKERAESLEKLAVHAQKEDLLKSRIQRLTEENDILNSKCGQLIRQWKDLSIGERIEELRKLRVEISEARKELTYDNASENEVKYTSSPLAMELAEADKSIEMPQPGVSPSINLRMIIDSLTAMTEDLREGISKNKANLVKAYSDADHSDIVKKNEVKVKELNEEITNLQEKLDDEAARFQTLECLINCSNAENDKLNERIEELEKELFKVEDNLNQTVAIKGRELNNLKQDIKIKDQKLDELVAELQMMLEGNDSLRTALNSQNLKLDRRESEEKELKRVIDELETENDELLKELSQQKQKLLDARRENIENQKLPREDVANLQDVLQGKINSMNEILDSIEKILGNDPWIQDHPCTSAIENSMEILNDISGLLKVIRNGWEVGDVCSCSLNAEVSAQSTGDHETQTEEYLESLEVTIDNLKSELENLKEENIRLGRKLKEKRVRFSEETKGGESDVILRLQEQLQERESQLEQMENQVVELQAESDTLTEYLSEVREKAIADSEAYRHQSENDQNHIQKLKRDCENQRLLFKSIQNELSQCVEKNQALDKQLRETLAEKQVLGEKLEEITRNTPGKDVIDNQDSEIDTEFYRRQADIHLNHIQKLQQDCENQRLRVKDFKNNLSEYKEKCEKQERKLKELAIEKQALEEELEKMKHNVQEATSSCAPSTDRATRVVELQEYNEKLNDKVEMYEAFFEQVKQEKVQSMKALENARENALMIKTKSDEKIADLEKKLGNKDVSRSKLQDTVTSLEKRIAALEAEKLESEKQMKAMVESMQGQNELEKCKKEWNELERELRNSILALTTEKADVQKGFEEQKLEIVQSSERLEMRMKELDECLKERNTLQEELTCLKREHLERKKDIELLENETNKMNEEIKEREKKVNLAQQSSSEIIEDLERQLKNRQDSETELKERATALSQQVLQFKAEKLESDQKIQSLMESINAESQVTHEEELRLKEKLFDMEVRILELAKEKRDDEEKSRQDIMLVKKESQEKVSALEKRLQEQSDSEAMLQGKVHSLEMRILQLNTEKTERDDNIKTVMEAINANKNLEEQLRKKEEIERELAQKVEELTMKFSKIRSSKEHLEHQLEKKQLEYNSASSESKFQYQKLKEDLGECAEREKELNERIKKLTEDKRKTVEISEQRETQARLAKKISEEKMEALEKRLLLERQAEEEVKLHCQRLNEDLDECAEREKELNERVKQLTEDKRKAEEISEEKESQAHLLKNISDEKIEVLEKRLLFKRQTEEDLKEKMALLENKITQIESEKSQHSKTISSIIRKSKAKEDLVEAIKAKDAAEMEYQKKIDEMEVIVSKLRKEKFKPDCDDELKERYKEEYEASRKDVRRLTENVKMCKERIKELQDLATGNIENGQRQEALKQGLHENIEVLKRSLNASDIGLFKTLQSLNEKITKLEVERSESEKVITAMLRSIEDKEKMEHCIAVSREADKKITRKMNEMAEAVHKLRVDKQRVEHELQKSEKLRLAKQCEFELLQRKSDATIYNLQQTLKERYESERKIQERLEVMNKKLVEMESEKEQADKTIQTMLESLQWEDKMELCLAEKEEIEKKLKRRLEEMKDKLVEMESEKEQADKTIQTMLESLQWKEKLELCLAEKEEIEKKLKRRLEEMNEKLVEMESEKEQADKTIQTMLESLQWKEKLELCLAEKEEIETELKRKVQKLTLENKEALMEATKYQAQSGDTRRMKELITSLKEKLLQMECDKDKVIESMKGRLQEKDEQIDTVEKTLNDEILKLKLQKKDLEIEATKCQVQSRDAFTLIKKQSRDFEDCLKERNESSNQLVTEMENLKESLVIAVKENEDLNRKAKKYAKLSEKRKEEVEETVQREIVLLQQLSDSQTALEVLKGEGRALEAQLNQTRTETTEAINIHREKITALSDTLQRSYEQEKKLQQVIDSLRNQTAALEEEKENIIQEGSKVVESLNMELDMQSKREQELKEQLDACDRERSQLRIELDEQANHESELREEKIIEVQKIRSEYANTTENLTTRISEMNSEIMKHITKENELRVEVDSARVEKEKLLLEVDAIEKEKSSSMKASRKLINELKSNENELVEKIDELKMCVKTLEGEKRRIGMEYKDYQSNIVNITQTSRDANTRLQEDLKTHRENNNNLEAQLREMRLKESCLQGERRLQERQNADNENKIISLKNRIQKQKNEITRLAEREGGFKDQMMELRSKISDLEKKKVQEDAERRTKQHNLSFETKVANAKIKDLQLYIRQRYQLEIKLKDEIETLKEKIEELNQAAEGEKLEKDEVTKQHSFSKGHIVELEEKINKRDEEINNLNRGSEELRAQVLCLQHEKQKISNSLENCQTFLNHRNIEIKIMEGKLSDLEALLNSSRRHNNQLTCLRDEMMANSMVLESRLDLISLRQVQEKTAKEFQDSEKIFFPSNRPYLEKRPHNSCVNIHLSSTCDTSHRASTMLNSNPM